MTGEAAVGPGGNEKGLLLGDLVNSTSRLQSLAEPGSVFVGDTTASLVRDAIGVQPAGSHQVKGKEEPITAWRAERVLSERGGRGRADVLEPPFVGRVSELRLLKDTLHATGRDSRARLVSLVGQAGIGKSRLLWEFLKYVDGLVDDIYWHEGRSPSYGDGIALWALGEMIRGRAGIQETDSEEVTVQRLREAVDQFVPADDSDWVRERLAALLGVGSQAVSERTELYAAARAFFEAIAQNGTTVLVFEDLHWADPSLLEFIEELPDWSQNHPIMVVTMARPDLLDRRPDWGSGRRGFTSLYLGPLGDGEMTELISGAVEGIPEEAAAQIVGAAGGVPLFAVEMLRMLLADGRLVVDGSGVTVTGDLGQIDVPSSVQAVISARLDRLPAEERELAKDAAVLGYSFTIEGLAALRDESLDKLERRLGDMVRHEVFTLIRDPRSPERGQYQWVQSVLKEVAYGRISRVDRRELHLKVARFFRDLNDPELAPVAASHFVSASEQSDGVDAPLQTEMVEAIHKAISRSHALHAHEQVLALVETALPVASPGLAAELREVGALAAVRLSDTETADRHSAGLEELARASGEVSLEHRAVALAGRVANETRRSGEVVDRLVSHLERHPDFGSDPYLAKAAVDLARALLLTGDEERAAALADEALGAAERFDLIREIADAMITRGTAFSVTRNHQAMALIRGALDIAQKHDLVDTSLRALTNIGYASQDVTETFEATRVAFEESKRVGDRSHASFVAANLTGGYLFLMDLDAVWELLNDPVWSSTASDQLHRFIALADLELRRGDRKAADDYLAKANQEAVQVTDVQAKQALKRIETVFMTVDGRYDEAFEVGRRHFEETPFVPAIWATIALLAAALAGDETMLRTAQGMAGSLPPGLFNGPLSAWAEAMIELVSGDVSRAVEMIDDLANGLRHDQLVWYELLLLMGTACHLPAGHEARDRHLLRVREICDESGADGLWDWAQRLTAPAN
jgi:tetratricopeptide (TPR) repeat protein